MKLSAVISTFNSATVLEDCLKSLSFADEIVVVDHKSLDETVKIAKKYTKHVFSQTNNPQEIDLQKNFGFEKATGDWILSVDADERVSEALSREINEAIQSDSGFSAYRMPRKNIIFNKWIEHSIWWPDYQLRLFKKDKGRYTKAKVHQNIEIDGTIGELKEPLDHQNYQSISQYLSKMDQYTENEANSFVSQNVHFLWIDIIRMPISDFLKTFFLQEGYKDGLHGLVLSVLQGFYMFLVVTKVWEKQGFREENSKDFLTTLVAEWGRIQQEMSYWVLTALDNNTSNPLTKISYKLKRKYTSRKIKDR
jgi:glycosyltransferase involved in cell wall biosynthesis